MFGENRQRKRLLQFRIRGTSDPRVHLLGKFHLIGRRDEIHIDIIASGLLSTPV